MSVQSNITIVFVTDGPHLPNGPIHHSKLDLQALISAHIDQMADELLEIGCPIPADRIFMIEALGGVVDVETGMVTHAKL